MEEFQAWLTNKLLSLESDDSVITDYINGILTGDESQPEKEEALQGILCGIMESGVEEFCQEIFAKWNECNSTSAKNQENGAAQKVDIEDQLSKIMEQQNLSATVTEKPKVSNADKKLKEAILQQYAEVSDHEEDEEGGGEEQLEAGKNTNRDEVTREEQERRERMKAEAAAKREKDKLDREKQKQQQAERKDKEKKRTAKTEKRR
ncbi:coiled-coil domain-containing protein 43-like [Amphibalanus amphitrite]|uniref:coiled-coil domain-containing protein 43-like n=1 Tax=Amphibalanus amphitrite TaxID=1232801 RepID=UPI001C9074A3|nr:coiled-coil domain-containing protein 43-like [Amphibalanus amphitrite]